MTRTRRPRFELTLLSDDAPQAAWDRLWDLDRHTSAVPLTRVRSADGRPLRAGARFVARTGIGAVRVDDRMVVREWEPPERAVVEKVGPLLGGTIRARVEPRGAGSRVRWEQTYSVRGLPDAVAALARPFVAAGYRRTLRAILGRPRAATTPSRPIPSAGGSR